MYQYKTEILNVSTKYVSDKANEKDTLELDELLNTREAASPSSGGAAHGWRLPATFAMPGRSMKSS